MLGSRDVERLNDEVWTDRRIGHNVYCANCGFNLRHAPYVGDCHECGQPYNARPLAMKGIFSPHEAHVPVGEVLLSALCLFVGVSMIVGGARAQQDYAVFGGACFAALGAGWGWTAANRARRYFKSRAIQRQIVAEESGDEDLF